MVRTSAFLTVLATTASIASAQTACSADSHCPKDSPCCSQYGQCGLGAYCLGGCDPRYSFSLDSCVPEPVCQSKTYTFSSLDGLTSNAKYLGDASTTDWVVSGNTLSYNDNVLLTMAPNTVGTVMATSTYLWYGNVKATLKTSRGQGVVTAMILLSDVKDEIDFEFIGSDLGTAQTNYYFQGITDYFNSANITLSDTFSNYHTYEIDWTPDTITWLVDGKVGRVKKRADTWNATSQQWQYPQTPARLQISLWPGGLASNAQGTIDWAGGLINWNSADIQSYGYDYAMLQSVTVNCYNASSAPGTNTGKSYTYNSAVGTNNTVVDGDKPTILDSLAGSGLNMTAGLLAATATATAQTIPGLSGAGPGTDGHASAADNSGTSATGTGTASSSESTCTAGFCQNVGSGSSKSAADKLISQERALMGSFVAAVVGVLFVATL